MFFKCFLLRIRDNKKKILRYFRKNNQMKIEGETSIEIIKVVSLKRCHIFPVARRCSLGLFGAGSDRVVVHIDADIYR